MTDAMGRYRGKMWRAWMPAWAIALLWLLFGLLGAAGAGAQGSPPLGTLVLHHDPSDPLSKALWDGDPRQLRASWPEGVELLVLDRGPRGVADSPVDRLRQAFGAGLSVVSTPERLPRAAVQALQRFGHERRTVSV